MRDYSGGAGTLSHRVLSEKLCRRHLKIAQGQGNRLLIFLHFSDRVLGVAPWGINSLFLACPVFKPNTLQELKNTLGQSDAGSPQSPRNFHAGDPKGAKGIWSRTGSKYDSSERQDDDRLGLNLFPFYSQCDSNTFVKVTEPHSSIK